MPPGVDGWPGRSPPGLSPSLTSGMPPAQRARWERYAKYRPKSIGPYPSPQTSFKGVFRRLACTYRR
jgi:hypothetical protein